MVLAVINGVRPEHVEKFFGAFGGDLEDSSAAGGSAKFNLCQTRVHAIVWPDGKKIEELKQGMTMKWLAHDPTPREISYLDVEKWLGEHCSFSVMDVAGPVPNVDFRPVKVEFIDKTELIIGVGTGDRFQIGNRIVSSPEFSQALKDLRALGQFEEKN